MSPESNTVARGVFLSYSRQDRERVIGVARYLENAGVFVWRDGKEILGGQNYGPRIVHGIKHSKVLILMCSNAAMSSKNVKQEIQLAWKYNLSYLPLLLEPISFPEQVEYWLEGWQWIEILSRPYDQWLPEVLKALAASDVTSETPTWLSAETKVMLRPPVPGLGGLWAMASFTDRIWPLPAHNAPQGTRSSLRDLGASQEHVQHGFRLGDRIRLAIESEREAHLLLLDQGTSGKIYCLCPSNFAPNTQLAKGCTFLPQKGTAYEAFEVSGKRGREQLLAILTDESLGLDWKPSDPSTPARVLDQADIDELLDCLKGLPGDSWLALSTYFDII